MDSTPISIATKEIGTVEQPKNSNNVKYNTWYYGKPVRGSDYKWCMVFVQWCFDKVGHKLPYKTASCSGLLNWYQSKSPERVVSKPKSNDIIIYTFGHTGIFEKDNGDGTITAIEGNTSADNNGSQSNGGGVFRRKREKTLVKAYIRPFDFEEEEIMTDKEIYEAYNIYAKTLPLNIGAKTKAEYDEAVKEGITDGTNPAGAVTRWQAAIMALRALKKR